MEHERYLRSPRKNYSGADIRDLKPVGKVLNVTVIPHICNLRYSDIN
jgi:hypothetical protein